MPIMGQTTFDQWLYERGLMLKRLDTLAKACTEDAANARRLFDFVSLHGQDGNEDIRFSPAEVYAAYQAYVRFRRAMKDLLDLLPEEAPHTQPGDHHGQNESTSIQLPPEVPTLR